MHGFLYQFPVARENATKPSLWGQPGKLVLVLFPLYGWQGKCMDFLVDFPSHPVKSVDWDVLFVLTKVVISDYKVFMISVSGKLWYQIQNDHWFWNLGFGVLLKSWANLANGKSFSDTFLPKKDNKSTKSSLHSCVYCQCNSMHLFYLFPHLYFDGSASFLRWPRTSYCCEARNYQKKLANDENKRV